MVTRQVREDGRSNVYSRRRIVSVVTPQNPTVVRHIPVTRLADAVAPGTVACTVFRTKKIVGIPRVAITKTNAQIAKVRVMMVSKKLRMESTRALTGWCSPWVRKISKTNQPKLGSCRVTEGVSIVSDRPISYRSTRLMKQVRRANGTALRIQRCSFEQLLLARHQED